MAVIGGVKNASRLIARNGAILKPTVNRREKIPASAQSNFAWTPYKPTPENNPFAHARVAAVRFWNS